MFSWFAGPSIRKWCPLFWSFLLTSWITLHHTVRVIASCTMCGGVHIKHAAAAAAAYFPSIITSYEWRTRVAIAMSAYLLSLLHQHFFFLIFTDELLINQPIVLKKEEEIWSNLFPVQGLLQIFC